ncbi:hypothetical protein, partial [Xenorhabdus santafensis]|uniref:hypothetical protein n=1 Tax=Xenorhabdus santafensis TaxID=2582833 RepID=UPI0029E8230E
RVRNTGDQPIRRGRSLPYLNRHRKGECKRTGRNILPVGRSLQGCESLPLDCANGEVTLTDCFIYLNN